MRDRLIPRLELDKKTQKRWFMEGDKLFNQIQNTLDSSVDGVTNHCNTIKDLWDYLKFLYVSNLVNKTCLTFMIYY